MARQMNLRHDTTYEILGSRYADIEAGISCDNCDRTITNIAEIQDRAGRKYTVGMDCAATLSGITDSIRLTWAQASFQEAKSARAAILRYLKKYPDAIVTVKTFKAHEGYYREDGAGKWECRSVPEGVHDYNAVWKQYPAKSWLTHILPMIKNLSKQT